jgi:hypothetical protein
MAGCVQDGNIPQQSSQEIEQQNMESQQQTMINNVPAPILSKSLERENIAARLQVLNDNSKVFYVYLVNYGKVMAFYTAKGKVSSLNSYMTPMQRIVADQACLDNCWGSSSCDKSGCYFTVEAPDQDGSYGENDNGVFFFTTEGAYVEWHGDYLVSDFALSLSTPAELVINLKSNMTA